MKRSHDPNLRCERCRMIRTLCICALEPRLPTRTRLVLVMHQLEANKTTNTGMLAARCLPNSAFVLRGQTRDGGNTLPAPPLDRPPWLDDPDGCVLLFPDESARPISDFRDHPQPLTLVVPDGTWGQALRARRRVPGLDRLPCVTVSGGDGRYRLRHAPQPGYISTLEAIARAMGALEGTDVQAALERIFTVMVERTLWSRGQLATELVTGGIPAAARTAGRQNLDSVTLSD